VLLSKSSSSSWSSSDAALVMAGLSRQQQQQQQEPVQLLPHTVMSDAPQLQLQLARRLLLARDGVTPAPALAPNSSSSSSGSSSGGSSRMSLLLLQWRPAPIDAEMAHFLKGLGIIAGGKSDNA
jgi:hypothetical protein